jgi:hypothetical protein
MRGITLALAFLLSSADRAPARTPTPTYGPSPTVTQTGSPTPTGTPPTPILMFTVAPNPARSRQRVTLDGSHNGPFQQSYEWSQIGGDVDLQLEDADQPIAHFTVPVLTRPSVVRVQLAATGFNSGPMGADITLLPVDGVVAAVGSGRGAPGSTVTVDVTLRALGFEVTQVEHDLGFGPYATVADRGGVPDCTVGPGLTATSSSFVFTPDGCTTDATCSGVRAALTVRDPIPDRAVVYRCAIALVAQAAPTEEGCTHALICEGGQGTSAGGEPLEVYCPDGSDGQVVADYAERPLAIDFQADPAAPHVGDDVRATFTVRGDGGLPSYRLAGAAPYLSGPTSLGGAGPLGADVSFPLHADCPGTAPLQLSIHYETLAGCPGNTYYRFTDATSPIFPVVVSDPDLTPTPPPVTPTALPTGDLGTHEIRGLVYDLSIGPDAAISEASVYYEVLGPSGDTGTVHTGSDGAFAFSVDLHDTDRVYVSVTAPGFESAALIRQAVDLVYVIPSLDIGLAPKNLVQKGWCAGDCDGDGVVTIGELIGGVRMVLGLADSASCAALDPNGEGATIDDLVAAVRNALHGCPAPPE